MHGSVLYIKNNPKNKSLFIIGGRVTESISNEIFILNFENKIWEKFCLLPMQLSCFCNVLIKHFIVIYGGTNGIEFSNSIILLNIETKK